LNIVHLAWEHRIPAYELSQPGDPETQAALAKLQPDVALVACFSRIIPASLLTLPRHGFLNLHPSRLPAYRGPEPIFWQLHDGINPVGVTLHRMDAGLDTGDIVGKTAVSLPDGISRSQIDNLCAEAGADLMLTALEQLAANTLPRQPQPAGGSSQPLPQPADFNLDTNWPAQRAFNFMRGTAEYARPYSLQVAGQTINLTEALAYEPDGKLGDVIVKGNGRAVYIQFSPGILYAQSHT
jgi:methionyl-tRNA formyltransferase